MRAAAAVALLTIALSAQPRAPDPARHLAGVTGTFVMLDAAANRYVRLNPARAAQRFPPCSTFKIPNTLIALQSGVAAEANHFVKYDPALKLEGQGPNGAWGRDHTLRSAFANSVVWYYQEIARRVGDARMSAFLRQFDYGDRDMSGGLDRFWLGTLRISANEQVEFLRRLYEGRLGVSARTTSIAKGIMVADETPRWRLSGKTGACRAEGEDVSMWYVGYVEKKGNVYYFALQFGAREYGELFAQRVIKARAILTDLGVLD